MTRSSTQIVNSKNILQLFAVLLFVLVSQQLFSQQRAQFTQYISNELLINPAYAGAEEALSISLLHRTQWSDIEGSPTTQALAGHSLVGSNKIGLGVTIVNDKIGIHKILTASASFAYRIQLKQDAFLSFGLQFGVNQTNSDFGSLSGQIQNPNDPKLNGGNISESNFEAGSGIYLITPRLNIGISMPNMLNENTSIDSLGYNLLDNNLYFLTRYSIPLTKNFTVQPGFLIKYINDSPLSLDVNLATVINRVLLVGISYRWQESINPIVQAKITPQLKIGYAYDYPFTGADSYGSNSHEFMLSYLFSFSQHKVSRLR
jgi:type IX secretion system PorP/SprF family membrane protein